MDAAPMYPYLFVTLAIIVSLQAFNISVSSALITGLRVFRLPAKDQPTNSVADASELLISRKQQKRMKNAKRQVVSLGSAENMVISLADPTYVKSLVNYALFDGVTMMIVFYALNWCLSMVARWYDMPGNPALELFAFLIMMTGIYSVAEVELNGRFTLHQEKIAMWATFTIATIAAGLLLLLGPQYIMDFGIRAGAQQLSASVAALITSALESRPGLAHMLPAEGGVVVDPLLVTAVLAIAAGAICGVTLGGGTRWGKLMLLATTPPHWGLQYFNTGIFMQLLLRLALLAPCVTVVLWVKPLTEVLGLGEGALTLLRPASALATACMQLAVMRKLIQAFLATAMVEWWSLKHSGVGDGDGERLGERMRIRNIYLNNHVTGKVALQLLAPATVLLCCSSVHLYAVLHGSEGTPAGTPPPGSFISSWAGFLSWWCSLWWFTITSSTVAVHRMGFAEISSSS